MKSTLSTAGRIIYALPMAVFGLFHFMNGSRMAGMIPSWLPGGVFWVYVTGAGLLAAAVSIIIQKKAGLATLLLGIMLVIFVLVLHLPGAMAGGDGAQLSTSMLLKDLALAGAAFYMSGNFSD
jgi:uncharacterized membrane protein